MSARKFRLTAKQRVADINPLDFCKWRHLKPLVYTVPIEIDDN